MEKKPTSKVKSLSGLFSFLLVLLIAAIGYVIFMAFKDLPPYSQEVHQNLSRANLTSEPTGSNASDSTLQTRASMFFTTQDKFEAQVKKDVMKYASITGIPVSSVSVESGDSAKLLASISVSSGVSYTDLTAFIKALEGSVPKITIESLSIKQTGQISADSITVESLLISMQVK